MNVIEPFVRMALAAPDRHAVALGKDIISYGQLLLHVTRIAENLRKAGLGPGDCLALAVRAPAGHVAMTLAAASLGVVTVAILGSMKSDEIGSLAEHLGAGYLVHDREDDLDAGYPSCRARLRLRQLLTSSNPAEPLIVHRADPLDPWRIMLSSGTTGRPKGIICSHGAALAGAELQRSIYPTSADDRLLIGMEAGMGFATVYWLRTLCSGACVVFQAIGTPEEALRIIHGPRITQMVTTTAKAAEMVNAASAPGSTHSSPPPGLRFINVGGGTVSASLRRALRRHVCDRLFVNYGSTETGQIALSDTLTQDQYPGATGRLLSWVEAQAIDEQGMPLPAGATGPLHFRSPCIGSAYAGPQADGTTAFHNGWFYSNDVGHVTPDGLVYLAGRKNDIINLSGVKLDPERIEAAILQDEAIKECVVVDVPGRLGEPLLVAVVVGGEADEDEALRVRCLALDPSAVPKIVLRAQNLPKNASGKILRAKVRAGIRLKSTQET